MHKVTDVGLDDSEVRSNQLGRDIREWRNKWELTQSDVANLLGVHRTTIAGWEEGKIEHPQIVHLAIEAVDERVHAEQLERWEHSHWTPFSRRLQPAPEPEIHAPLQPRLHQAGDSLEWFSGSGDKRRYHSGTVLQVVGQGYVVVDDEYDSQATGRVFLVKNEQLGQ